MKLRTITILIITLIALSAHSHTYAGEWSMQQDSTVAKKASAPLEAAGTEVADSLLLAKIEQNIDSLTAIKPYVKLTRREERDSTRLAKYYASRKDEDPTLTAAWAPILVEHIVGIRGGYGFGNARFEPQRSTEMVGGLLNFGVSYKFNVPKQKYVGTIEADLSYMEKGFAYETFNESGVIYSRRYSVIELPILWQPYLPLSKNGSRFFISAGPFVSYALSGSYKIYNKTDGTEIEKGPYVYDILRDNSWEYGITAGAGFIVAIKRFLISAEFRYNITLSDVLKGVTKYPENPFRSPVDQMNISLGLHFKL